MSIAFGKEDLNALRARLKTTTDEQLIKFGKACMSLLTRRLPLQSEEAWRSQREAARDERRRRYPKIQKPG
jgi:hypothetical protein